MREPSRHRTRRRRAVLHLVLAAAFSLVVTDWAAAQANSPLPRIAGAVDDARLTALRGNVHPLARPAYDQGTADRSFVLGRMTMMFQPTAAQQSDLDALLAAQQNPTSPNFHQWLTPDQYADRFGIAQSDLAKIVSWLQAQGFVVVETPRSRNSVVFSGTAAQVDAAFHTEIHNYTANGKKFYANSAEPSVPAAFAGLVLGIRGLQNFPLNSRSIASKAADVSARPNFTSSVSGANYVTPPDFATIYDLNPLYASSPAIDGTGQSIVIVGQSNIVPADIARFRSLSGLSANVPQVILVGTVNPGVIDGDVQEAELDIEWSGAVARNATIKYVYADANSGGVFDALQYAVEQNLAPVIAMSYGLCEAGFPAAEISALVATAQQANSQGITIVAATGDGGATDCDGDLKNYPAELGLTVDIPASLPYVTGVGGTEFNEGNGTYWLPKGATDIVNSALSYIPEKVWNDTSSAGLSAGGGGASLLFGKPSWQTGTDGVRDVPDLAINASPDHDGYLVCTQVSGSSPLVSGCMNTTNGFRISNTNTNLQAYGGTSFGAPVFAGLLAMINQKTASAGQGNANYILYPLAAGSPTAFHDTTVGDNTSPCVQGTENCPNGGVIGFSAGLGYDPATGLGTFDGTNLVNAWSSFSAPGGSAPVLSSIFPTGTSADAADFTLTATGSNFATNAQILWNGSTLGVTMQPNGTSTSIKATISHTLVAYGTTASVTVTDNSPMAGESSASENFTVTGSAPPNDNIANAIAVTSNNFISPVDNSAATTESTDPTPPCALTGPVPSTNPRTKTVWWSLTAASSGTVTVTTIGSVYDTTLSVWTGTPGSLTNVACDDDVSSGTYVQSLLRFTATGGTKYFIMVAPFGPPGDDSGGKTVLNVSNGNPSPLSASPSSQTVAAGSSATYTIMNTDVVSYVLTCSGLPTGAACPSPSVSVPAMSSVALIITTTSRTLSALSAPSRRDFRINLWHEVLGVLASCAVLLVVRRRRTFAFVPVGALALLIVFFAAGCGSSGSSGGGGGGTTNPNGTPAGTYTITVTGTAASTHTTTITLVVN